MKRFDLANEVAKQLITISAAIITLVVAFYEKFFAHNTVTFLFVLAALTLFIFSVTAGALGIGGLALLAEEQESNDFRAGDAARTPTDFVPLAESPAESYMRFQQILFGLGLLLFIAVAIANYATSSDIVPSKQAAFAAAQDRLEQPIVWAQLHPDQFDADGLLIARAIVGRGEECPAAVIGAIRMPMTARTAPADQEFPRTVCEIRYTGTDVATIAGVALPQRPSNLDRILVLGDTGCRVTHYVAQECNDDEKWPFARIAEAAAKLKPQLIVHVGDYHYREKACADHAGCSNSPHGDNWRTWKAEFFDPVHPLLTSAPWIMLRGNHETCARAGAGWQLLMWPELRAGTRGCRGKVDAYQLDFRDLSMIVLDTAEAEDSQGRTQRVKAYQDEIRALSARLSDTGGVQRNLWLLLHQPLWVSYGNCSDTEPLACTESDFFSSIEGRTDVTVDLKQSLRTKLESPLDSYRKWFGSLIPRTNGGTDMLPRPNVSLVLSGDTHMFQMFAPRRPAFQNFPLQLVAGMGGDLLEREENFSRLLERSGKSARLFDVEGRLWARREYGYVLLTRDKGKWTATTYDVAGRARMRCDLAKEECEAP